MEEIRQRAERALNSVDYADGDPIRVEAMAVFKRHSMADIVYLLHKLGITVTV